LLTTSGVLAGITIFLASRALGFSFAPLVGVAGATAIAAFVRAVRWSELAASTATTSASSSWRALLMDAIVLTAFVAAADPAAKVWAPPLVWLDLFRLSAVGSATAVVFYLIAAMATSTGREGSLPPRMRWFLLLAPYLANLVLSLTSPLVRAVFSGFAPIAVLAIFNEVLVVGLGVTIDRRFTRDLRFHALLLAGAAGAFAAPFVADLGSSAAASRLSEPLQLVQVVATTMLAQAGLWAETFLVTGVIMDALRGRRPTFFAAFRHWREGGTKAAIYSGWFMLLVHTFGFTFSADAFASASRELPLLVPAVCGALLFPLVKTIVESFDGSRPFFERLGESVRSAPNYARGLVVGLGLGAAFSGFLDFDSAGARFVFGFAVGAAAYAGIDVLLDAIALLRGPRKLFQPLRLYALGALLGGVVGGSLAWYFDPPQMTAVSEKFKGYFAVFYPAAGLPVADYVIYPLFSKWGAIDLGSVSGGVRLFFSESLSGVINWSLAAPLFSINLVALTALVQRDTGPLKGLLTKDGVVGVLEQAFRVQRWGLWMAPVIYSFLRMAPDPTWYNQDGAIRTAAAVAQSFTLSGPEFRAWSLDVFLGLLAYDWLRVLIWFDHMGLRVATLVNASFVVGDALDEKAARFLGHSMTARCIPEGIRRFATWGPLLIPFYIPRGAEWERVWNQADVVRAQATSLAPPVGDVVFTYSLTACAASMLLVGLLLRKRGTSFAISDARDAAEPFRSWRVASARLGNGLATVEVGGDGRGFSAARSMIRGCPELDLTKRPDGSRSIRGKFFYLRELRGDGKDAGEVWSSTYEPTRHAAGDYAFEQPSPTTAVIRNAHDGIRVETRVTVAATQSVELWVLRLENLEARPRRIEITSYQELAIADREAYERHPSYHSLHVGTWFVRPLGAILAYNRKLGTAAGDGERVRRDIAFHAVQSDASGRVRLVGYEDSRSLFIGSGTLRSPDAIENSDMRAPDDEGLGYSFDPAASLQLHVDLPAEGFVELRFADGYATSEHEAAALISKYLGTTLPNAAALDTALAKTRLALDRQRLDPERLPFEFSADGTELTVDWDTSRPWTHVLANELGHGAVLSNDGQIFSFAANSQQNSLTPFLPDSIPAQRLGQAIYVVDEETRLVDTPTFAPMRRREHEHDVVFGRGYATYKKTRPDADLELTVFVPPDEPVEVHLLRIRNRSRHTKRYRVVPYFEIVLAEIARDSRGHIASIADPELHALFFTNPANPFVRGFAFVASSLAWDAHETSGARFFGGGDRDATNPHFVEHGAPDLTQSADGTTVAAFAGSIEVPAGADVNVVVTIGQAKSLADARALISRYRQPIEAARALEQTRQWWQRTLSVLRVRTTSPEVDRLVNDWLPYQILTARLWGRTGSNQRSGGFGYRDQLQDVIPLVALAPDIARKQILLHARQQFLEGDVLQWWHYSAEGKTGIGARNHASDPHLWLVYVTDHYVRGSGDRTILDEIVPFLEGPRVRLAEGGKVFAARESRETGSLYDHCRLAVDRALEHRGANGLPLIERGDWNDGLDLLGAKGRGESVWLGFFLYDVLRRFTILTRERGDVAGAERYTREAERLHSALARMWRDDRYVRLTTDAGEEILLWDALMTSWPILSGAVDLARGRTLLDAALEKLEQDHLIQLVDPPFTEKSEPYPGKIAEYPPGVRENAGQYSHGTSWIVDALVQLGELADSSNDKKLAARCRQRALEIWTKISPLDKQTLAHVDRYGLPPHQQAADIYFGDGYSGRGGWSWYTGAAARMLSGSDSLLGLRVENGDVTCTEHAGDPKGPLRLLGVTYRGRVLFGGRG
jgi:cyclic beta-1,2-glucan synthetase